jgi:hypothetical protein
MGVILISDVFLDSCVFQSYAIEFESVNHFMSNHVFTNPSYTKYTSSRVFSELERVKKKRLVLYSLYLEYKGDLTKEILDKLDIHLNDNDRSHLQSLFEYLSRYKDTLAVLRAFLRQYRNSLDDAIQLVNLFTSIDRPYLRDLIVGNGIHKEDAEIIIDAYYWSNEKFNPKYITIERNSIQNNRDIVMHILTHQCNEFPPTGLELLNIAELALTPD